MRYDFICVGGGYLSTHLTGELLKSGASVLVVSDHSSLNFSDHVSYDYFLKQVNDFESSQMLILSRFDLLAENLTERLISRLRFSGIEKFGKITYISSVAVYPSSRQPAFESEPNPQTEYGRSKLEVENKLIAGVGDSVTVLRVSNLYGAPGVSKLESAIVASLKSKVQLRLPASAVIRDFVYVGDLVSFFSFHSLEFPPGTFNFASASSTSLAHFVNKWSLGFSLEFGLSLVDPVILESVISNLSFVTATNFRFTPLDIGISLSQKTLL
jgi:hypothetical protein